MTDTLKYNYKKKENGKNNTGRPSKYKPEYCQLMVDMFSIPKYERVLKEVVNGKNDYHKEVYENLPNPLPTFEKFQRKIGIGHQCFWEWTKDIPEFGESYRVCKDLQKEFLNENALLEIYNPIYAKFVAINITDMRDKTEQEVTVKTFEHFKTAKDKYGI